MNRKFLWNPNLAERIFLTIVLILFVDIISYLHYITGLAYEFNVLYLLPILIASWLLGDIASAIVVIACLADWAITDIRLAGEQSTCMALITNTATRACTILFVIVLMKKMRRALQREWNSSRKDPLTGLYNRRYFYEIGIQILETLRRQSSYISIAIIDLDNFKNVNDSFGHPTGDLLLQSVSKIMQANFRDEDVLARLGGDEFAVIMPRIRAEDAMTRLEILRNNIRVSMKEAGWPVTASIGVATFDAIMGDIDSMLAIADEALYEAKRTGRDTIVLRTSHS